MQINGSQPSIAPLRPTARTPVELGARTIDAAAPAQSEGSAASGGTQIVDASTILANWGTSNALADLNVDGIVDAQDLAMVLEQGGNGGTASENAWNAATGGDLNGDGIVDAQDLALSLNAQQSSAAAADAWNAAAGGDLNGDGMVNAEDLALSLNAQQSSAASEDAWTAAAGGDLNGDGTVDAQDLALSLNGQQGGTAANEPPTPSIQRLVDAAIELRDHNGDGQLNAKELSMRHGRFFEMLDLDQSGQVTREELTQALSEQFDRARSAMPNLTEQAFARRWMDAFSGERTMPDFGMLSRVHRAFERSHGMPNIPIKFLSAQA